NVNDHDTREALTAVIDRRRAAESGVVIDPRPGNATAAGVAERFNTQLDKFLSEFSEQRATSAFSDQAINKVLIFLARVAYGHDNGRPRCRSFVHYLREAFPVDPPQESAVATP